MHSAKKKIALIGGGGYLGRHLANILSPLYEVIATSRNGKEQCLQVDLLLPETVEQLKQHGPFESVFILASGLQGLGTTVLKQAYLDLDTKCLAGFLQFISDQQLSKKIIYTSSMTVYGSRNAVPVSENGVLQPLSSYGLSKMLGENIFRFFCDTTEIKGVILRIPGLYGGDRTSGFIYHTARKCLKQEQIEIDTSSLGYWETMHVEDCCQVIKSFLDAYDWECDCNVFNIGYGTKTDIIECAQKIKQLLHASSEIKILSEKGYVDFYLDSSKIKQYAPERFSYSNSLERYLKSMVS